MRQGRVRVPDLGRIWICDALQASTSGFTSLFQERFPVPGDVNDPNPQSGLAQHDFLFLHNTLLGFVYVILTAFQVFSKEQAVQLDGPHA